MAVDFCLLELIVFNDPSTYAFVTYTGGAGRPKPAPPAGARGAAKIQGALFQPSLAPIMHCSGSKTLSFSPRRSGDRAWPRPGRLVLPLRRTRRRPGARSSS